MSRKTKKPLGGGCSLARMLAAGALAVSVAASPAIGAAAVLGSGALALAPQQAWANDAGFIITGNKGYTYESDVLTVQDEADLTVSTSGQTSHRIVVAENAEATITLTGVNITAPTENPQPAIDLASGATLTLILADGSANTLTGGAGGTENGVSGIHAPTATTLIIRGGGSLSVNGGSSETGYGGSGIGGNPAGTPLEAAEGCGTVVILATGSIQITGGNGSSTADGHDIGGGKGSPDDGDDGQGIKPVPGQVNTYEVWGELTLPEGVEIPEGAILTGSGSLTPKLPQAAPTTGSFLTISHTDSSIMLNFSDSSQFVNGNGIEVACAAGMGPDAPADGWIAAKRIGTSRVHVATIENLSPGTPYTLFARYKGDGFHEPSPAFASESVYYTDPKITTESLPNAYVGVEYSAKLEAQVADGITVRWSIEDGSLPGGLTLREDGTISGTPTAVTPQAVNITVCATFGKGAETKESTKTLSLSVTKSDTELGDLTVTGNTGMPEGSFQYGDTITVTFTPRRKAVPSAQALAKTSAAANALTPDTATLTYTPAGGEPVTLATASAQADGSFTLTYDTKQKTLPTKVNLPLTVSYGGSGALNPVTKIVTVTLHKGRLRNQPSISGSYAYGETLTVNYTPQDDEKLSYQWFRSDSTSYAEIDGATSAAYTLTSEDIGKHVYVQIMPADEWHTGLLRSSPQVVTKATQAAPSAPTAAGTTTCSATLSAIPANANGVAAEYGISKDGGKTWTWQGGPEFTGLSADTTYQFAARYGETDLYTVSDSSAPVNIATDRLNPGGDTPGGDPGDDTPGGDPGDDTPGGNPGGDGSEEDPGPEGPTDPIVPDTDTPDPGDPTDPGAPQKKPALPETADPAAALGIIAMVGATATTAGTVLAKRRRD